MMEVQYFVMILICSLWNSRSLGFPQPERVNCNDFELRFSRSMRRSFSSWHVTTRCTPSQLLDVVVVQVQQVSKLICSNAYAQLTPAVAWISFYLSTGWPILKAFLITFVALSVSFNLLCLWWIIRANVAVFRFNKPCYRDSPHQPMVVMCSAAGILKDNAKKDSVTRSKSVAPWLTRSFPRRMTSVFEP